MTSLMKRMLAVGVILIAINAPALAQDENLTPQMPGPDPAQTGAQLPTSTITTLGARADLVAAPILTLDQDVLYLSSDWGNRAQAQLEAEGDVVAAENERLTQLLSSEEARLTEQRGTLPPAEFRTLAENFDLRATEVRRERAQAVQQLNSWAEADRSAFFRAALPLMGQMMQERGAVAVLDRRTLFVSLDAIDVTGDLIDELNSELGDGKGAVPLPQEDEASGQTGDPVAEQGE
jgi:Skp family chaperone for outer membrane proteins